MKLRIIYVICLNVIFNKLSGQYTNDPSSMTRWMVDRFEIKSGKISPYLHTAQRPYARDQMAQISDSMKLSGSRLSPTDFSNLDFFQTDNPEGTASQKGNQTNRKGIFYNQKAVFFQHSGKDYFVYINPVIDMQAGRGLNSSNNLYTNTRGIEIRGAINNKVGFYSLILENQLWAPEYLRRYIVGHSGVIPGAGFVKTFKTGQFNNAYDFFNSRAYITFSATKNIRFQFGQDRNFIGNGYRSFILSDWANEYPFLKIQSKFGPFQYQNLFAKLSHFQGFNIGIQPQEKYMALHHLSYNLSRNINLGVFESVIFERNDPTQSRGFDLAYLNPVIFYRSVEHNNNSSDNQTLGLDFKWNALRQFSFYGQVVFDEFLLHDLVRQNGKWTNKYALQGGFKYIDVLGIRNLDWQTEYNLARPYIFTHFRPATNYAHYGLPLAHPYGANFKEWVNLVRFQPNGKMFFTFKYIWSLCGMDTGKTHYGGNIFLDYHQRVGAGNPNYVHQIGDGVKARTHYLECLFSYMVRHNIFFDVQVVIRNQKSELSEFNYSDKYILTGVRMNISRRDYAF